MEPVFLSGISRQANTILLVHTITLVICKDKNNIGTPVFYISGIGGGATKIKK